MEDDVRKEKSSLVDGTNDREAFPKRWVAALVHMNCEKKVATKLDKLGIENYVAIQTEAKIKFLTYPGTRKLATPIPDNQIEQLKLLLEKAESPVTFCNHVEIGDVVKINNGSLKGFMGYCCGVSNSEIAIYLDLLGYATTHVPKDYIKM